MTHQHRFWNMGDKFECSCGATREDTRTDEQRERDRERATLILKVNVNTRLGVESPNMRARIAELS